MGTQWGGEIRGHMLSQLIANGLIAGGTYALIALGFSLIYGVCRFFHFAHAAVIVCAGYLVFALSSRLGVPLSLAVVLSIVLSSAMGALLERAIYRPLRAKHASSLMLLVASLGIYVVVQNVISVVFGDDPHALLSGLPTQGISMFGARITFIQVIILIVTLLLYSATGFFIAHTSAGRTIRAVASDSELARIVGIDANRVMLLVFALGSGLAAAAGILISFNVELTPTMGFDALLMGVVAAIVGGIASVPGALLGGFLVGLSQHLGVWKLPSQWQDAIVFVILVLFLVLRPQGILGTPVRSAAV